MKFKRESGILLHISSLPGQFGSGDLGREAYNFVDWLASVGQRLWQILPLSGLGPGYSPYMSPSAFAGNEIFISLEALADLGLLSSEDLKAPSNLEADRINFKEVIPFRMDRLKTAARAFESHQSKDLRQRFESYCKTNQNWLEDYALFMVLSEKFGGAIWSDWPEALRNRKANALAKACKASAKEVYFWKFCQWQFHEQWDALHSYALSKDVKILGDIPIFVSENSSDVWTNQQLFKLDDKGKPLKVAGVPPDYFSDIGQRWGNPLYNWAKHQEDHFSWWTQRIRHTLSFVDIVRIDHFRAFYNCWEIPAEEETAVNGRWVKTPGQEMLAHFATTLGEVPLIAEDLGDIPEEVIALRKQFDIPGMAVLQFAWDGNSENSFLPHNHEENMLVYTGTHDNDTTVGWWISASEEDRHRVREYLRTPADFICRDLINAAMFSPAAQVIIPMQDLLELGNDARMNEPGKGEGNWSWRFEWSDIPKHQSEFLSRKTQESGRCN